MTTAVTAATQMRIEALVAFLVAILISILWFEIRREKAHACGQRTESTLEMVLHQLGAAVAAFILGAVCLHFNSLHWTLVFMDMGFTFAIIALVPVCFSHNRKNADPVQ